MMRGRRGLVGAFVVAVLAVSLASCSQPGDGGYRVTAEFPTTVALYAHSRVKLMGVDVGTVRSVRIAGDHIEVAMSIDRNVPLPADVQAAIVPLSLIGERNVVLHPAWQPGMAKAGAGAVIGLDRTQVPVEPDEALKAVTDLAQAIDPAQLDQLIHNGAAALKDHGADLNAALAQAGTLTTTLASQDQALLAIIANIHELAGTLDARQQQLATLLEDFSTATGVLANERDAISRFISALAELVDNGSALITKYQAQLPGDVATLAQVVLTVRANADSVLEFLRSLDASSHLVIDAHDPQLHTITVRLTLTPTVLAALQPFFTALGLGPVPCVPLPGIACPGGAG